MTVLTSLLGGMGLRLLAWAAATAAVAAILLGARQAGRNAERVEQMQQNLEAKDAQLQAASRRPRTRAELSSRMRDGTF